MANICSYQTNEVLCNKTEERDGLCTKHWRLLWGHDPSTKGLGQDKGNEVPAYCTKCRTVMGQLTEDNHCPAKVVKLSPESPIGQFLTNLLGAELPFLTSEVPSKFTPDEALDLIARLIVLVPACPKCNTKGCAEWFERYITWVMQSMLGPYGFMSMFIAYLERSGGEMEFSKEELEQATLVLKVESEMEEGGETFRAKILERASDFGNKEPEAGDDSGYWPDLISEEDN